MMKKITYTILFFIVFNFGFGQTTLSAGDIAITGFNSDNPDQFSFVLLTDVLNTTQIKFTDDGWLSSGNFRGSEGIITWTATSDLACGTEIIITDNSPFSSSSGTVTDSGSLQLSTTGDQILAYQGTEASPTFIYAIHFDGITGWSADAIDANTSAIPSGLINGTNAIAINDTDNATYDCSVTSDTSLILAGISNSSNWTSSGSILTLGSCYFSCAACSGGTVTWNGAWVGGTPDLTTQVIIDASYTTNGTNGSFSACSLNITTGNTLTIDDGYHIEVQNDITVDIGSSIAVQPQGAVVQIDNSGSVINNGTITVDKETAPMNAWYEYTYWSSPVSDETISGAITDSNPYRRFIFEAQNFLDATAESNNDNTATTGQDDIDDNGDDWQLVSGATIMQVGVGYATTITPFAYDAALGNQFRYTFTGDFNNGIVTVPIYRNDSELSDYNWNFVGNPYPSAIDADLFLAANSNVATDVVTSKSIDGAIFLWSQNTVPSDTTNGNAVLNFSNNDYAIINAVGENAGGDGVTPNRYIPSGQGFFISMSNSAPATVESGTVYRANVDVTFNNSMRVKGATDNSQFFKNTNTKEKSNTAASNKLWLNLTSDNGVFNQILVGYVNGATNDDDGLSYDTTKFPAEGSTALYSIIDGSNKKFAIQGKATNSLSSDEIIKLGFKTSIEVATLYKLSVAQLQGDFLTNNTIYLKDNLLNKLHDLSASDYTFTSEVGEFNDRFEIIFNATALSTNDVSIEENQFSIIDLDNDKVQFNTNNSLNIKTIRVYDLLGRQLYYLKGASSSETYRLSNLNNSIYIAKVELSNGSVITKKAIK